MAPAQPHEIIAHGDRQIAHRPVGIDPERAVPLGQFRAVRTMNERNVRHDRHAPAERVVDLGLARGVGEVIVTADDVGNAHIVVIDYDCEHVSRRAVRTQQYEIIEVFVLPFDPPLHLVLDHGRACQRCFEPDHRLDPGRGLGRIAIAPPAVIELGTPFAARLLAHLRELLRRGVAAVGAPRFQQRLGHLAVALGARELVDCLVVPIQAEPGKPIEDGLDRSLRGAFAVGVLDPQQHLPAAPAGIEPVEQGGARAADMQEARGRGSKARDDGLGHVGWFLQRFRLRWRFGGPRSQHRARPSLQRIDRLSAGSV